jgi:hypothetical protein
VFVVRGEGDKGVKRELYIKYVRNLIFIVRVCVLQVLQAIRCFSPRRSSLRWRFFLAKYGTEAHKREEHLFRCHGYEIRIHTVTFLNKPTGRKES